MADNVAITAGAGTTVATDERSINSTNVHVQRTDEQGGTSIANGQASVTSAANIVGARDTRKVLTLLNVGSIDVYVGVATVSTSNGFKLVPGASLDIPTTAAVQGVVASGTGTIHYVEVYDA